MNRPAQAMTQQYYAEHAEEYYQRTCSVDMADVYAPFEAQLEAASRILDLGCGSGRDARHFADSGHRVVALDPCREMLTLARSHSSDDQRTRMAFTLGGAPRLAFAEGSFEAVWACASLLHLTRQEMSTALTECRRVLVRGGVLFVAVKQGAGEAIQTGRYFTFWNTSELSRLILEAGFVLNDLHTRPSLQEPNLIWIDVIARHPNIS